MKPECAAILARLSHEDQEAVARAIEVREKRVSILNADAREKVGRMAVQDHLASLKATRADFVRQIEQQKATEPKEQRQNSARRKAIEEMTPEEKDAEIQRLRAERATDPLTGLGNRTAYDEAPKKAIQASIDIDALKWVNDNMGHASGDALIKAAGQALREAGLDAYHISGDEFVAQFDSHEQARDALDAVRERLSQATIKAELPDGRIITKKGVEYSYGVGENLEHAESDLHQDKRWRADAGVRAERGGEPPGVAREAPAGQPDQERATAPAGRAADASAPTGRPGDTAGPVGEAAFRRPDTPAFAGVSHSAIRKTLYNTFGKRAIDGLIDSGVLRVVNSVEDLPAHVQAQIERSGNQFVDAVHDNGHVYLLADHLAPSKVVPVMFHELGEHYGLKAMIGDDGYSSLLDSVRNADRASNPLIDEAWKRTVENYPDLPEGSERFLSEVIARVGESAEALKQPWMQRVLQAVRDFLRGIGVTLKATDQELMGLVRASLTRVIDQASALGHGDRRSSPLGPAVAASTEKAPIFYSELARQVNAVKTESASPEQWLATIKNLKGVKADEVEWSGVTDWLKLQQGKVTKEQVSDFLKNNGVKVEETMLGGEGSDVYRAAARKAADANEREHAAWREVEREIPPIRQVDRANLPWWGVGLAGAPVEAAEALAKARAAGLSDAHIELLRKYGEERLAAIDAKEARDQAKQGAETRYSQYTLPGGENYRELLLTLPERAGQSKFDPAKVTLKRDVRSTTQGSTSILYDGKHLATYGDDPQLQPGGGYKQKSDAHWMETAKRVFEGGDPRNSISSLSGAFRSSHFDQPNILAHVRFDTRTDAEGKKVLFIQEIQSDWAQKGKREGFYLPSLTELPDTYRVARAQDGKWRVEQAQAETFNGNTFRPTVAVADTRAAAIADALNKINNGERANRVPPAPFVGKTEAWVALAVKPMIRYAAENGYDRVAWTNGEQQAARYDLSKQISKVMYDGKDIRAFGNDARVALDRRATPQDLPELIGKEAAERLMEKEPNAAGYRVLQGLDLKVGGEGMKAFYDKIVPNVVNDVLKKLGGERVGEVRLPSDGARTYDDLNALSDRIAAQVYGRGTTYGSLPAEAQAKIREMVKNRELEQPGFDITPALRDTGQKPLPLFSRFKPSGDDTLDSARKKAGLVKDTRNTIERARDYLGQGWDAIKNDILAWKDSLEQGMADRFLSIKKLEDGMGLPAEQSGYVAARLSTGVSSVMRGILLHGQPEWRDGIIQRKEDTKGLLEVLKPVKEDFDDWVGWMVGMRARRLMREDREHNLSPDEINALIKLGNGKEERFLDVARDFAGFKRSILDLAENAGLLDAGTRPVWDQADWIPFYRVRQDDTATGPRGKKGLSGQASGIRMLKGGEGQLNDPLENILMNFSHLIGASMKNVALDRALQTAEGKEIAQKIGWDMKQELVPNDQIRKALLDSGVAQEVVDTMPPNVFDGIRQMWAIKAPTEPDVVRVMRDGSPEFYRINDPLLLRSLSAMDTPNRGWTKPFRIFKRTLTQAVTADPAFMARNFLRDALSAWSISNDHFRPGIDSIRGALKSFTEKGGMVDMMFAGGSFMGGYVNGNDPVATAAATRAALRDKGWNAASMNEFMSSLVDTPAKYWQKWEEVGSHIENANREAVYEAAMRNDKSKAQAIYEAKDLMDYSMQGDWALFQVINDMVPFFNARLQGLYKLGRAISDDPMRVTGRGLLLSAATLALMGLNDGDPKYEQLEEWDKDTYWHFWLGGKHLRVPKPFEIGVIFATLPERLYRFGWGKDVDRGDSGKLLKQAWWNLATNLNLVNWPQMVSPAIDLYANKDNFTGRPIEGMTDQGKLPESRSSALTSDTMKAIARTFPDAVNATGMSPKRLEHLWHGYLGELGMYGLHLSDIAVRALTGAPAQPSPRMDDLPLVKAFLREDPARGTRWTTDLYDMHQEADNVYRTVMAYQREGDVDKAGRLLERKALGDDSTYADKLGARPALDDAAKALSAAGKERDQVYRDTTMSPQEKRERLDQLQEAENQISEQVARGVRPAFQ